MADRNCKPLSKCTDDEIEEEAARRRALRIKNKSRLKFCDECKHFRVWGKNTEIPESELMNACNLGHKTKFIMPEHPNDDDWGFYRVPCTDREIEINRKWTWQIEREKSEKQRKDLIESKKEEERIQWNMKLQERKIKQKPTEE